MIEHLLDEALVWALRRGAGALDERDIAKAKLTEEVGLGHPVEYTDHEQRLIATHEAGHAVVAYLAGRDGLAPEPLRRLDVLSIIKRGGALGVTGHSDRDEHYTRSRRELEWLVRISFGGMVAEELMFGEAGSGVSADLAQATNLAATMVGSLGMGGSLISLDAASVSGAGNIVSKVLGDDEARQALERILGEAKAEVTAMMRRHRHLVEALRDALVAHTELVGDEIVEVIELAEAAASEPRAKVIDLREDVAHPA
jgi:ATP-dependent Zn protease